MNTDQQELAAYQRAVETAKNEIAELRQRAELAEALAREVQAQRDQAEEDALVTRAAIVEWEDAYDRLHGAFELRMAVDECHAALAGYVGSYYDVVLGENAERMERAEATNAVLRQVIQTCSRDASKGMLRSEDAGAALLAELAQARAALDQIDRHVVGACASDTGDMPEPCEECGEMREIAAQALAAMKKARSA